MPSNPLFGFSHKELRGIAVWLVVLLFFWFLPELYGWVYGYAEPDALTTEQQQELDAFLAQARMDEKKSWNHRAPSEAQRLASVRYQLFDPNQLDEKVGKQLGLSERQIRMIQRYVEKGGRFREKEDFKKIYALTEKDYERLSPYIQIKETLSRTTYPEKKAPTDFVPSTKEKEPVLSIDLNHTDSTELLALPGIGPVFASRIVRYRDLLGGFYEVQQLQDVYGMDEDRFQAVKERVMASPADVRKIPINQADYQQLRAHPYINSNQANALVRYREQHGNFATLEDLRPIVLIDADFLRKIAPYLSFE